MPQVPTYQGPQARPTPLQGGFQSAEAYTTGARQAQVAAAGMMQASEVFDRVAVRDAQTEAWNTQAKINDDFVKWNAEARKNAQGANAKGYTQQVTDWWEQARKDYADKLTPLARQAINKSLGTAHQAALESATTYQTQQLDIGERSALDATVSSLANQAVAAGPDRGQAVLGQIGDTLRTYGAQKGLDMTPAILRVTTGVHVTNINQLMQVDPKAAEVYFNTHKDQIDGNQWDNVKTRLESVAAVTDGENKAKDIWGKFVTPGDYKNPIDMFGAEAAMREAFPNDPTRQKAGLQSLREMANAWNKSQLEYAAANTNAVYAQLDQGAKLVDVMRSPAWQNLSGAEQHKITTQLEAQAAARESRAAAAESRAAAREQRGLNALLRQDRMLMIQNGDQFLDYSDPTKLVGMTRDQVKASRSLFGLAGAEHLLNKWDSLHKPGAITEAKMDTEDFNHTAESLGLNPYDTRKSDKEKAALGELKFRVEQLIDTAQRKKGQALTREEKSTLMRDEMARTVTLDGFLGFSFNQSTVPVIQLTPEQVSKVVVPQADRATLTGEMKKLYAVNQNPLYAPSEENLQRYYLTKRSRAAELIGTKK